jgi:hypothetical protein
MKIKLIPKIGHAPIVLDVSQFMVVDENDTPISVGATYGPDGASAVSCVGCNDFNRMLRALGVNQTVILTKIQLPQVEAGSRLLVNPT